MMNYWIISTIAISVVLVAVLILDSRMMNKMHGVVSAACSDARHWQRKCEELRLEISTREQRDARQVAHLVLIRDEEIENLKRTMADMKETHKKEMAVREKTIFRLEKTINDNWPKATGKGKVHEPM